VLGDLLAHPSGGAGGTRGQHPTTGIASPVLLGSSHAPQALDEGGREGGARPIDESAWSLVVDFLLVGGVYHV